jgi:hypothetical protein
MEDSLVPASRTRQPLEISQRMGYSQKVEGSSFPMVVVSGRTILEMLRNEHLKMGDFKSKSHY